MFGKMLVFAVVMLSPIFILSSTYSTIHLGLTKAAPSLDQISEPHTAWVLESLKKMETIKPGMTRAELLTVFTTEGGESNGLRRTYAYQECPYFKVDVEFTPVGRPAHDRNGRVTLDESDADVIKTISRPYLDWSIAD